MKLWSVAFSYRLGLGFHALNNEGADGSNLMQPRRIDVGEVTYDGISGEIIRHHILENFVNLCSAQGVPMLPLSAGLHPDRGPIGIRAAAKILTKSEVSKDNLFECVRKAIALCAVLDVGGYLAAWKEDAGGQKKEPVAEKQYLDSECASYKDAEPVKRESCFDVAWLISEQPQDLTVTQHSAFRNTAAMNSRFAQTMRSNVYGGVIRADLHRVGTDDYWYLQMNPKRLAVTAAEQLKRQQTLIEAIVNFIASPTGAKVAGWAPHVFLTEGAILLTSSRTAPFVSPIRVDVQDKNAPVALNASYATDMEKLKNDTDTWVWKFKSTDELLAAGKSVLKTLDEKAGKSDSEKGSEKQE